MTAGATGARSTKFRLVLLVALPLAVAAGAGLVGSIGNRGSAEARAAETEQRLQRSFDTILAQIGRIAERALESSPREAWAAAQALPKRLGRRVEGIALLDPDLTPQAWEGSPAGAPATFGDPAGPDWLVRVEGVRTRLLARAGPDDRGRLGLVSFVVDSSIDDLRFVNLLAAELPGDLQLEVTFGRPPDTPGPGRKRLPLVSPSGEVLAIADLLPASPEVRARNVRLAGQAWAALLFVGLLASLFDWRAVGAGRFGLLLILVAVAAGRALLIWQNAAARLLPRELGSPSLYGSSRLWGLLESPTDLLLSCLALYLLCLALRSRAARLQPGSLALRLALAPAALLVTLAVFGIADSLSRNSRIPILDRPAPFEWDVRLALWIALLLPVLGAAELWTTLLRPLRRGAVIALVTVLLCTGASVKMQHDAGRIAVERLGTDFAPQVLEQSARRELALAQAMLEIVDNYDPGEAHDAEYLAYRHWVDSELFRSRYKSSIDIYTAAGEPLSHFGFGLPPLDERVDALEPSEDSGAIRTEWIPLGAHEPRLLHAERPILRAGERVAVAVGHVLDEPDNLPFLPWTRAYLAALGPGVLSDGFPELQYVLYDAFGHVQLTTLLQPPAETEELRGAAGQRRTVGVRAGDEPYRALALAEEDGRLHALLLPERTSAERLGAVVRLILLALLLLGTLTLARNVIRNRGTGQLWPMLRGSFYRKLVAALLLASIVPLVGLALFLRGYLERRGDAMLVQSATQFVSAAQRVVEDYSAGGEFDAEINDSVLHWLRRIVGQEIHVYRDGRLAATSTRALFDSGLLERRLDGEVRRQLIEQGVPYLVAPMAVGSLTIPVAYAPVREEGRAVTPTVVAVPLVLEQREIARGVSRVAEMILLATVALVGLLVVVAARVAGTVARPLRELVEATAEIAAGQYQTRLEPNTEDEVAELVEGFNTMAAALADQRADLERRRDYIETILRHATTGVISLDVEGGVVTFNPAAKQLLSGAPLEIGIAFGEMLEAAKPFGPLFHALRQARSGDPVDADLAGTTQRRLRAVRVELRRPDGERFGTLILIEDVTELMRSNQLEAWAEMARSIAHEIKNPLTPIQLSAEHLLRLLADRPDGPTDGERACVETVIKQVRALYDIAGEFSAYARLPALAPEPTDPVLFMREVLAPYRAACPPGVTIDERYSEAPQVAADPRVLSRAVINLIENALQAMPDGGRLTVGVKADDGQVELSVADSGSGIDPEVRRRLFEPYFSTKSSGTGLGLAIVRRAVEAHGGTIDVESEADRGTVFRIRLPGRSG